MRAGFGLVCVALAAVCSPGCGLLKGRNVLVAPEPGPSCRKVGPVESTITCDLKKSPYERFGMSRDACIQSVTRELKGEAATVGANLIVISRTGLADGKAEGRGVSYFCPDLVAPAPPRKKAKQITVAGSSNDVASCAYVENLTATTPPRRERSKLHAERIAELERLLIEKGVNADTILVTEHRTDVSTAVAYRCKKREQPIASRGVQTSAASAGSGSHSKPAARRATRSGARGTARAVPRLLVLDLAVLGDEVEWRVATLMTDLLIDELARTGVVHAMGKTDVPGLDRAREREILRCDLATSCIAEICKDLGADMVLSGRIGYLGSSYMFNLAVIDTKRARVIGRVNKTVARNEDALAPAAPGLAREVAASISRSR